MKNANLFLPLILASLVHFNLAQAANIFFTAAGDGTSWEDPNNWNSGAVPTTVDIVNISSNHTVFINQIGAVAQRLVLKSDAVLTINENANLTINEGNNGLDAIDLLERARLNNNGGLSVENAAGDAIEMKGESIFSNRGVFTAFNIFDDLIDLNDEAIVTNNFFMDLSNGDRLGINLKQQSSFFNSGDLYLTDINAGGIYTDSIAYFRNLGFIRISGISTGDGIRLNSIFRLDNNGEIDVIHIQNEGNGISVVNGAFFNRPDGELFAGFVTGNVVLVEPGGEFRNRGRVFLTGVGSNDVVEVQANGSFNNFGKNRFKGNRTK